MTPLTARDVRRLERDGWNPADIARGLRLPLDAVLQALVRPILKPDPRLPTALAYARGRTPPPASARNARS